MVNEERIHKAINSITFTPQAGEDGLITDETIFKLLEDLETECPGGFECGDLVTAAKLGAKTQKALDNPLTVEHLKRK